MIDKHLKKLRKLAMLLIIMVCLGFSCSNDNINDPISNPRDNFVRSYSFNSEMSENVLRSYLSRSITMSGILFESVWYDGDAPYREDDERMVLNIGAKFIGRTIFMWGRDNNINNPLFLSEAKEKIERMHAIDADIIFQAGIFEIVTPSVNEVFVPAYVFEAFEIPVENRNFKYDDMLNLNGWTGQWGGVNKGSAPDVTRMESKLWYYFLATKYMNIGIEAIHWGQVNMTAFDDKSNKYQSWFELIGKVREYASEQARRKFVLNDGHAGTTGVVVDGQILLDFNSFPMRFRDKAGEPQKSEMVITSRTIYRQSKGGTTYSGWDCDHLPYLVEFDNFGISDTPGEFDSTGKTHWGYDEITWFALQPEEYRNEFLWYTVNWLKEKDPNGYIQMPGKRVITPNTTTWGNQYRANSSNGDMSELGYNQELTIKQIWNEN